MNKIIHLDCSLRDGGYYNNWDFSEEFINSYLNVLEIINVDYCEIGFRFAKNNGFKGSCAFTTEEFINALSIPKKLKIAVMINASDLVNNKKLNFETIKKLIPVKSNESKVDLIRVACHAELIETIIPLFEFISDYGYASACNITQISEKSSEEIRRITSLLEKSKVDIIYFADSLGSLVPQDIKEISSSIRENWSGPIGIHTHDSQGLALSNTLESIKCDISWLDSTITGIGRGPGNVKTEELVIELQDFKKQRLNLVPLIKLINDKFMPLKNKYLWGTNIFYFLAGKYSIHPTYIQSMISDFRYQEEDLLASIDYLKNHGGKRFSFDDLNELRKFYKGEPKGSWSPKLIFQNRDVLIIGPGKQVKKHEKALIAFIKKNNPLVIAINTQTLSDNELIDFRVACHPIRLLTDIPLHLKLKQPLIVPLSNLPPEFCNLLNSKETFDYGIGISNGDFEAFEKYCLIPNSLVISYALALVKGGNGNQIYLAGFDGYNSDDSRNDEINELFSKFRNSYPNTKVIAITSTKYKNISSKSVYGLC